MTSRKVPVVEKDEDAESEEIMSKESTDRQFITALARGLDVLASFEKNDPPLSNQELARRTRLPRPTISRITYTLTELGYLRYDEQYGCYTLGGATLALGRVATANFDLLRSTRPAMERMAQRAGANVGLGVREGSDMLYIDACVGPALVVLRFEAGARVPLLNTAMGYAYIAAASAQERVSLIKQIKRHDKNEETEIMHRLDRAAYELKTYGFCMSLGEWHDDINGAAVPIRSPEFGGLFVLNCGGPAYLLTRARLLKEVGPLLIETAAEMKAMMGSAVRIRHT